MILLVSALLLSYFLGGTPTSILVGRIFRGIDIREHGSGNAGGTNAFRVLGWKLALPVMLVDVCKGTVATLVFSKIAMTGVNWPATALQLSCGIAAVLGHIWTPYAHFRGGKGVGTALGVMIALAPLPMLLAAIIWIGLVMFTGYVSVGSMVAALFVPVLLILVANWRHQSVDTILLVATVPLVILIVFTHRSNIRRLLAGMENRFATPVVKARRREADS